MMSAKKNTKKFNLKLRFHALKRAFITSLLGAFLGMGIVGFVDYAYQYITPDRWWVVYESIQSEGEIISNKILFQSTSGYPNGGDVTWSDQLWCDFGQGMVLYSSFTDTLNNIRKNEISSSDWLYQGFYPAPGVECELRANVTVRTGFGIKKQASKVSNIFTIQGG